MEGTALNAIYGQGAVGCMVGETKVNPKLVSAAHEFEASLMQEFLKPLQEDPLFARDGGGGSDSLGNLEGGSGDNVGSAGALLGMGSEALAKAISDRGGFGIATRILNHFRTAGEDAEGGKCM